MIRYIFNVFTNLDDPVTFKCHQGRSFFKCRSSFTLINYLVTIDSLLRNNHHSLLLRFLIFVKFFNEIFGVQMVMGLTSSNV